MSVPKSRRKESKFEASHQLFDLRDEVTRLVLYDFGFSAKKYRAQIDKFREWRRLKAYRKLLDRDEISYEDIEQAARSWMGSYTKLMSKKQIKHMKMLYFELFGKELTWKQKSHSKTSRKSRQKSTDPAISRTQSRTSRKTSA